MTEADPRVIIIAGPNGARKTTFSREFLPQEAQCPVFVNADLIAAALSPFAPEAAAIKAARIMQREIDENVPTNAVLPLKPRCLFGVMRQNFYYGVQRATG